MSDGRFRVQVRTYRAPGWLVPLMLLLGLAMIPVALTLGAAFLAVLFATGALGVLVHWVARALGHGEPPRRPRIGARDTRGAIGVEYEAKDSDEKG